jgi:hypothetical protein
MAFINLVKTNMVLIYGEDRGHSELAWQIYGEKFPQSKEVKIASLVVRQNCPPNLKIFSGSQTNRFL